MGNTPQELRDKAFALVKKLSIVLNSSRVRPDIKYAAILKLKLELESKYPDNEYFAAAREAFSKMTPPQREETVEFNRDSVDLQ